MVPREELTFSGHLDELRLRLFRCGIAWAVVFVAFYLLRDVTFAYFVRPVGALVYLSPAGAFMMHMKVAAVLAGLLVFPYCLHQVVGFVSPALEAAGRRTLAWGSVAMVLLFYTGSAFGWLLMRRTVDFLSEFSTDTLRPMVTADAYLGFVLAMVVGCGLVFQMPMVVGLLVRLGLLSTAALRSSWRSALLGSLIAAALITPSGDAITQLMLTGPIFGLYLLSIAIASFIEKKEGRSSMEAA
jgi:sec-independent protein translocase protein TatC